MFFKILVFGLLLTYVPSPSTAACHWGTKSWCVKILRALFWFSKEAVDDRCCISSGVDHLLLCTEKDFRGNCTMHRVPADKCVQTQQTHPVLSINTFNHCFRFYERDDCTGESLGVQRDVDKLYNFKGFTSGNVVRSMSRCFRSDLCVVQEDSSFYYAPGCHWPNDRLYHGSLKWLVFDKTGLEGGPQLWYQRGKYANRTDVMHAHITTDHVARWGPDIDENTRRYVQNAGFPGDEVGLIIPRWLGGSGSDLRNVYPQSTDFKRRSWSKLCKRIQEWIWRYGSVYFTVNLAYHLVTDTRPYLIIYRIRKGNLTDDVIINDFVNPQRE